MRIASCWTVCAALVFAAGVSGLLADDKPEPKKEAAEKTKEVKARDLTLVVPESWQSVKASGFRAAQLTIPPAAKDKDKGGGEYVVFVFGGGAGSVADNVKRWTDQFEAEGRKVKVFTGESKHGKYTLADLRGTWNKPIGPPMLRQSKKVGGWRVLAAILETENETYYLRLDAPEATATAVEAAFRQSFGADPKKEQEKTE